MTNDDFDSFIQAVDAAVSRTKAIMDDPRIMEPIHVPKIVNEDMLKKEMELRDLFDIKDTMENLTLHRKEMYNG